VVEVKKSHSVDMTYSDVMYPVRSEFGEAHLRYWKRLGHSGSWWTGAERVAIAREVRAAWDCPLCATRREALSPHSVAGEHSRVSELSDAAVDAVHRITTDASRLTQSWYRGLLADGLTQGHYVELVGTVVSVVSIDAFAHAIGAVVRPLPESVDDEPDSYWPQTVGPDDAWVPMVPIDNEGTPEADLWPSGATGNVVRAMSLVPEEVRTLKDLSAAHYLPMGLVRQAGVSRGGALSRSQMELTAGRTSALNACYY
jgi:hypothetical protein